MNRSSLRYQIVTAVIIVCSLVGLLMAALLTVYGDQSERQGLVQIEHFLELLVEQSMCPIRTFLGSEDLPRLSADLQQLAAREQISAVGVYGLDGSLITSAGLLPSENLTEAEKDVLEDERLIGRHEVAGIYSARYGAAVLQNQEPIGYLVLYYSLEETLAQRRASRNQLLGAFFALTLLIAYVVVRKIEDIAIRPIQSLQKMMHRIAIDQSGEEIAPFQISEFDTMAQSVNFMSRRVKEAKTELEELVAQRTATLQQSEEKHRLFLENFNGIAYQSQAPLMQPLMLYGTVREICGYRADDFLSGKLAWADIIHEKDRSQVEQQMCHGKDAEPIVIEYRIWARGRELRWVRDVSRQVYDDAGNLRFIQGAIYDITVRKLALEAVEVSERRFRSFVEKSRDIVFTLTAEGVFRYISPNWKELLGHEAEEVMNQSFSQFVLDEDQPKCSQFLQDLMAGRQGRDGVEYRVLHKDGTVRWHAATGALIESEGEPLFLGTARDVSEQKALETRLLYQSELQALIAKISSEFIRVEPQTIDGQLDAMLEACGSFLAVDRFYLLQFSSDSTQLWNTHEWCAKGVPPMKASLQGKKLTELPLLSEIFRSQSTLAISDVEKMATGEDKRELQRQSIGAIFAVPLIKGGQLLGYLGVDMVKSTRWLDDGQQEFVRILGNITADAIAKHRAGQEILAAKEAADRANAAKSDFLANMSHEIRTPMNAVVGFTELMLKTSVTPKQQDHLKKIRAASNTLLHLINDILDFSKIEAGKVELEEESFYLPSLVNHVVSMVGDSARDKGLEIHTRVERAVPRQLQGDPHRLEQVLLNLLSNAVKFTSEGEIVVGVELKEHDGRQVTLTFAVRDTGIGISKTQQEQLFQPFVQADGSTTRRFGGTGLGLAISQSLVQIMGGSIGVVSEVGKGSTFHFTVRLQQADEAPTLRRMPERVGTLRALVIDDSASARHTHQDILENFGFQVTACAAAEQALAALETEDFDVVLLDEKMPEQNGVQLAAEIRRRIRKVQPLLLMVTAYGNESLVRQATSVGITSVLMKPVSESLLFDTIMENLCPAAKTSRLKERELESAALQGATVLLVEDTPMNQELAVELLQSFGVTVDTVNNGAEALQALEQNHQRYDAILMDLQMPVMDGYEAARQIRTRAEWKQIPLIAVTAHAIEGDRERVQAVGMNDYLTKPIDSSKLHKVLSLWIGGDGTAAATCEEDAPAAAGRLLNREAALVRLGGRESLYQRLVQGFLEENAAGLAPIRGALDANDLATARRLAHSLKGSAATVGADHLSQAAAALEQTIQDGGELTLRLSELQDQLNAIWPALQSEAVVTDDSEGETAPAELDGLIDKLQQQLMQGSFAAIATFTRLREAVAHRVPAKELDELGMQVKAFSREEAAASLKKLRKALGEVDADATV